MVFLYSCLSGIHQPEHCHCNVVLSRLYTFRNTHCRKSSLSRSSPLRSLYPAVRFVAVSHMWGLQISVAWRVNSDLTRTVFSQRHPTVFETTFSLNLYTQSTMIVGERSCCRSFESFYATLHGHRGPFGHLLRLVEVALHGQVWVRYTAR